MHEAKYLIQEAASSSADVNQPMLEDVEVEGDIHYGNKL